jgi:NADPH:quinone reductase-like Zn-dependent oxidoreductase
MKSWLLENTGRESLRLVNISEPNPGPGQILVRTTAVSAKLCMRQPAETIERKQICFH